MCTRNLHAAERNTGRSEGSGCAQLTPENHSCHSAVLQILLQTCILTPCKKYFLTTNTTHNNPMTNDANGSTNDGCAMCCTTGLQNKNGCQASMHSVHEWRRKMKNCKTTVCAYTNLCTTSRTKKCHTTFTGWPILATLRQFQDDPCSRIPSVGSPPVPLNNCQTNAHLRH